MGETIHGEGVYPLQASPVQLEQAQSRFVKAKELYDAGDFLAALKEFAASRAIVASPNARLYIARCLKAQGDEINAYATYGRTLIESLELAQSEARYGQTAEAARMEREELATRLAFVKVTVHKPRAETELFVNGEQIRRTAWGEPIVVQPGEVQLKLVSPGAEETTRELSLMAGETGEVVLVVKAARPQPPPEEPRASESISSPPRVRPDSGLRPYAYGSAVVALLGLGAFGTYGVLSNQTYEDLEAECGDGSCPRSQGKEIDKGERQQMFANLGLAVGVLATGAAVTLFAVDGGRQEPTVALKLTPVGVAVGGSL